MYCRNHPEISAKTACAGCGEFFCADCLVTLADVHWCAACKTRALDPQDLQTAGRENCEAADTALKLAIISLFCFGIFLGPLAVSKGLSAKKEIEANPDLKGDAKATAAIMIGICSALLWILGLVSRFASA